MSCISVVLRQAGFAELKTNIMPRHLTGIVFLGAVYFCAFFIDFGLAEDVTIVRDIKPNGPIPEVVPDQFVLPQTYCPNGVPECEMFGAIAATNGSCLCTGDVSEHNATTFGFVDNVWRCRNDSLLRMRSVEFTQFKSRYNKSIWFT